MKEANLLKDELPKPTYWPVIMAISMTTLAWGLISGWMISVVGGLGLLVSIVGWMKEVS
jgi:hypothetical protein